MAEDGADALADRAASEAPGIGAASAAPVVTTANETTAHESAALIQVAFIVCLSICPGKAPKARTNRVRARDATDQRYSPVRAVSRYPVQENEDEPNGRPAQHGKQAMLNQI